MDESRGIHVDERTRMIDAMVASAIKAGAAIMKIYDAGFDVAVKADNSPVTVADSAAEAIILDDLARLAPQIAVVAEEEAAAGRIPSVGRRFFIVDPLDGTKEFIQRRGDFTVNIALIEDRRPILGVVYAPARNQLFAGDVASGTAWAAEVTPEGEVVARRTIRVRARPKGGIAVVASKSHNNPETDAYLAGFDVADRVSVGSSLKFCLVAAGEADLYPRLAPTCEWDTGAGHAVLLAAGGQVHGPDGSPLLYAKERFYNPGFVASGDLVPPAIGPFMRA